MPADQPKNPLHGVTLETIVTKLVERYGFDELGKLVDIRCFRHDPSVKSSLHFLRRTPWARKKVEELFASRLPEIQGPSAKISGNDGERPIPIGPPRGGKA